MLTNYSCSSLLYQCISLKLLFMSQFLCCNDARNNLATQPIIMIDTDLGYILLIYKYGHVMLCYVPFN